MIEGTWNGQVEVFPGQKQRACCFTDILSGERFQGTRNSVLPSYSAFISERTSIMKLLTILTVFAATSQLGTALPAPTQDLDVDALHKGLAALGAALSQITNTKRDESLVESPEVVVKRQLVYQNFYFCPRDVEGNEGPWKRVPCLPEDDAASKVKRQLVYQNYYFCPRSVDGVWKRVPCLPEDAAASKKKRFTEATSAAEAKLAEWEAEWKV